MVITLWQLIWRKENHPKYLLKKFFSNHFMFHSNVSFENILLKQFLLFHQGVLINWKTFFCSSSKNLSCILSEVPWFNSDSKIDSNVVFLKCFSIKNINFVYQLFNKNGVVKKWETLKANESKSYGLFPTNIVTSCSA